MERFLEKTFEDVWSLKNRDPDASFFTDKDHAVEEWFEIMKAVRAWKQTLREDKNTTERTQKAKAHVREEIVDLAICCFAMFLSLGGTPAEFMKLAARKLKKWGRNLTKKGL